MHLTIFIGLTDSESNPSLQLKRQTLYTTRPSELFKLQKIQNTKNSLNTAKILFQIFDEDFCSCQRCTGAGVKQNFPEPDWTRS